MALPRKAIAQAGSSAMDKARGKNKIYTGCVKAGHAAGAFTPTDASSDMEMH